MRDNLLKLTVLARNSAIMDILSSLKLDYVVVAKLVVTWMSTPEPYTIVNVLTIDVVYEGTADPLV